MTKRLPKSGRAKRRQNKIQSISVVPSYWYNFVIFFSNSIHLKKKEQKQQLKVIQS